MDNSGYKSAPQFGTSINQFPPFSNVSLVDNLEQALRMPARLHSEMVYFNRYNDEIYRIYTDYANGKQYMVLEAKLKQIPKTEKQDESDSIDKRFSDIEKALEVINAKLDNKTNDRSTKSTDATDAAE